MHHTHGGARRGAGRQRPDRAQALRRYQVLLDPDSADALRALGGGNLSAGIRRAVGHAPPADTGPATIFDEPLPRGLSIRPGGGGRTQFRLTVQRNGTRLRATLRGLNPASADDRLTAFSIAEWIGVLKTHPNFTPDFFFDIAHNPKRRGLILPRSHEMPMETYELEYALAKQIPAIEAGAAVVYTSYGDIPLTGELAAKVAILIRELFERRLEQRRQAEQNGANNQAIGHKD